jgi:5-formyltetrahydrofolate cyclo-ligase
MTKDELRAEAHRIRALAAEADPDAATRLSAHWPAALKPLFVAGYRPIRDELDPTHLLQALIERGARGCLPVTPPKGSGAPLSFRLWSPGDPLERSDWGVMEPTAAGHPVTPDLILTPLLAFDAAGHRLGWGQGHFDRTLRSLRASGRVVAIGLAFAAQRRDDLIVEPHDEPLDGVLTETGYIPVREVF